MDKYAIINWIQDKISLDDGNGSTQCHYLHDTMNGVWLQADDGLVYEVTFNVKQIKITPCVEE